MARASGSRIEATDPASGAVVRLDHLSVTFGETRALDDISLELLPGHSLALIGPNGSGKSTLLNVVAGLVQPSTGSIQPRPLPPVAYVLQHHHQRHWLPLTGREVLMMGRFRDRGLLKRLGSRDRSLLASAAERMNVSDLLDRPFDDLSGGQRQRVLVAQALAQEPQVLLMDEPITGLDLTSQRAILDLIDAEAARGTSVVITTHHLDEARHCDRVALLAGSLIAIGAPSDVLEEDTLRAVFGARVLGDHEHHDHPTDLLVIDDHGHED
jgi:ABC-type Mn2+/Zn2+ transport system ATPase subunit